MSGEKRKSYIQIAFESGWFAVGFARGLVKAAIQAGGDALLTNPNLDHFRQTSSLHAARLGIKAVVDGRGKEAPELEFFGEATAIRAAVRASRDQETRPRVVDEIVEIIAEAGINPELSPLLGDDEAEEAQKLIEGNNRIIDILPQSEA
jgi:hypothetical protein